MSKHKSAIGLMPAVRRQPPPMHPTPPFATAPPVAADPSAPSSIDWLKLPTAPPSAVVLAQARALRRELIERMQKTGSGRKREQLAASLSHVNAWFRRVEVLADPLPSPPRASAPPGPATLSVPAQPPSSPRATAPGSSRPPFPASDPATTPSLPLRLGELRRQTAKLQRRITDLQQVQSARATRLADPSLHADRAAFTAARAEYETGQAKLDELIGRHDFAEAELEALEHRPPRPAPAAPPALPPPRPARSLMGPLGTRLVTLREARGMTCEVVAQRAQLTVQLVDELERGFRPSISFDTLAALARALDISVSELVVGVDVPLPPDAARVHALLAGRSPEALRDILRVLEVTVAVL